MDRNVQPTRAEIVADPQAEATGLCPVLTHSRWGRLQTVDSPNTPDPRARKAFLTEMNG